MSVKMLVSTVFWTFCLLSTCVIGQNDIAEKCGLPLLDGVDICLGQVPLIDLGSPVNTLTCKFNIVTPDKNGKPIDYWLGTEPYPDRYLTEAEKVIRDAQFNHGNYHNQIFQPVNYTTLNNGVLATSNEFLTYYLAYVGDLPDYAAPAWDANLYNGKPVKSPKIAGALPLRAGFKCVDGAPKLVIIPPEGTQFYSTGAIGRNTQARLYKSGTDPMGFVPVGALTIEPQ